MTNKLTIVTGYFGAPVLETARALADAKASAFLVLDEEIVRRDGRSIIRICMLEGEHSYRNKEYEVLADLAANGASPGDGSAGSGPGTGEDIVVACGDGVLHDEMSRDIALAGELVIVGEDMSEDELWENARLDENTYHAFMKFGTEDEKREKFKGLHERQQVLFDNVKAMGK